MIALPIGQDRIREYLPHRPPFLFVDRVLELEPERRILAELELRASEPHFEGHFPGNPVMPGVLILEALAQTAGLLLAFTAESRGLDARGALFYLARSEMKWTRPAVPGETLLLEALHQKSLEQLVAFEVSAATRQAGIARGKLTLARVK